MVDVYSEDYDVCSGSSVSGEVHIWSRRELTPRHVLKCGRTLTTFGGGVRGRVCVDNDEDDNGDDEVVIVAAVRPTLTSNSFTGFTDVGDAPMKCAAPDLITVVTVGNQGDTIVAAGADSGRIYVWEMTTGKAFDSAAQRGDEKFDKRRGPRRERLKKILFVFLCPVCVELNDISFGNKIKVRS